MKKLLMAALVATVSVLPMQAQAATVFDGSGSGFLIPFGANTQTSTISLSDLGRVGSVTFAFDIFGHTAPRELTATVTHNGVTAVLFSGVTGFRAMLGSYDFAENAPTLLKDGAGFLTIDEGTYKYTYSVPGVSFAGSDIAGDWTLSIADNGSVRAGVGGLSGWSVSGVAAVPEPATWAMMILGFGFVGAALRQRKQQGRKQQARVTYSMA